VLLYARHEVNLLYTVKVAVVPQMGYVGNVQYRKVPVIPPPNLTLKDQIRNIDGILSKVGDGAFKMWPQAYWTKQDLETARFVQIDGQTWSFVQGTLVDEASGIFFSGVLNRERENDNLVFVPEVIL